MTARCVRLFPCWSGPTAGYRAELVTVTECEWTGEDVIDPVLDDHDRPIVGPWSDALLRADVLAARWAASLGERYDA